MRYVVQCPHGLHSLFDAPPGGTHAVLVRNSAEDRWKVYGVYESEKKAHAARPMRRVIENVMTFEESASRDRGEDIEKPYMWITVRQVDGILLPLSFLLEK